MYLSDVKLGLLGSNDYVDKAKPNLTLLTLLTVLHLTLPLIMLPL